VAQHGAGTKRRHRAGQRDPAAPRAPGASGHLQNFTDPLVECKKCHHRFRADQMADAHKCPDCGGEMMPARQFNHECSKRFSDRWRHRERGLFAAGNARDFREFLQK